MSGFRVPETTRDAIVLADGSPLSAEAFYSQRDARTTVSQQLPSQAYSVVIALSDAVALSEEGQTALMWTCSMLRRMGRAFAGIRIASSSEARAHLYVGTLHRSRGRLTLEEAMTVELLGADPFSAIAWSTLDAPDIFAGAESVIWL